MDKKQTSQFFLDATLTNEELLQVFIKYTVQEKVNR